MKLPLAGNSDLVIQELGKELLVYNLTTHQAYQLNETSMIVFNHCDGQTSFDDLKKKHKFTDDLIYLTLDQLRDEGLIGEYQSKFAGIARREVIRKIGLASLVALPFISSVIAPTAAQAQSASTDACAPSGCNCTLPADSTATTCPDPNDCVGTGCVCVLNGTCSPSNDTKICFGTCGVIIL